MLALPMRSRIGWLVALGLCLRLSTAAAAPPADKSSDARVQEARAFFAVGLNHFQQGEYDAAIVAFQAGYRLKPLPLFLFNIAQSARKAKKAQLAIDYYQQYIAQETAGGVQQLAEARVQLDLLKRELATAPPPVAPTAGSPATAPPPVNVGVIAAGPTAPLVSASHDRPWWKRAWFWGAVAGVAVAGTAVGLGVGLGVHAGAPQPTLGAVTF